MLVTQRRIELSDGTRIQAGTAADAAHICKVKTNSYMIYERELGAPGPILIPERGTGTLVPARDAKTGARLYDLNAVRRWHQSRPGKGRFAELATAESLRRTPLREAVLADAEQGRVAVDPATGRLLADRLVAAPAGPRAAPRVVTDLRSLGLLTAPDDAGRIRLTTEGEAVLARFRQEAAR